MKKLLFIPFILLSIAAYSQMNTFGGIGLRVNDTTTYQTNAADFHTAGYYDIYFNNQATNDHWDIWNGSSYDHIFAFGQGSGGAWGSITGTLSAQTDLQTALDLKAPLVSPTFTGTPTLPTGTIATTQTAGNSSTAVATTAFVTTADNLKANLASPTFTGTVTTPLLKITSGSPGTGKVLMSDADGDATWEPNNSPPFDRKTADYTLTVADVGRGIEMDVATANVVTIPNNSTEAIPINTQISVVWYGVGATSIAAAGGVTINSSSNVYTVPSRYGVVVLRKVGTNEWILWNGTPALAWVDWTSGLNVVGFSSTTILQASYIDNGATITLQFQVSGTSNSGTFSIDLPFPTNAVYATDGIWQPIMTTSNGTTALGIIYGGGSTSTLTLHPLITGGPFSASGTKRARCTLTYRK